MRCLPAIGLVECDRREHGAEQQGDAACEALDACESAAWGALEYGEPYVSVGEVLTCLAPEQVIEARQLLHAGDRHHAVNLGNTG